MSPDLAGLRVLLLSDESLAAPSDDLAEAARSAGAHVDVVTRLAKPHWSDLRAMAASHDLVHVVTSGARPRSWILTALTGLVARATRTHTAVTLQDAACPRHLVTPARALAARAALVPYDEIIGSTDEIALALRRIGARIDRLSVAGITADRADGLGHALSIYSRYAPHSHASHTP